MLRCICKVAQNKKIDGNRLRCLLRKKNTNFLETQQAKEGGDKPFNHTEETHRWRKDRGGRDGFLAHMHNEMGTKTKCKRGGT